MFLVVSYNMFPWCALQSVGVFRWDHYRHCRYICDSPGVRVLEATLRRHAAAGTVGHMYMYSSGLKGGHGQLEGGHEQGWQALG